MVEPDEMVPTLGRKARLNSPTQKVQSLRRSSEAYLRAFYETAGVVKIFVFAFAFVFSLLALLFLPLLLPVLVCCIHLGLLSALWVNRLLGSVPGGVR